MSLHYDDSKDLSGGQIIEIDGHNQYQVAMVLPNFREEYGHKFAAVDDLYEALKDLRHHAQVMGEVLGLTESHIQNILAPTDKALAKAES